MIFSLVFLGFFELDGVGVFGFWGGCSFSKRKGMGYNWFFVGFVVFFLEGF